MLSSSENAVRVWPVGCNEHSRSPAIARCTTCKSYICSACRRVEDNGLALCLSCLNKVNRSGIMFERSTPGLAERYAKTVYEIIVRPSQFVREINLEGRLGPAILFGFASIIIGQIAFLLWSLLLIPDLWETQIATMAEELDISRRNLQMILIGWMPVFALLRVPFYGLLLQVGVLLTDANRCFRYRDYVRLFGYASAAYLLLLIPWVIGVLLAFVFVVTICWYGLRHHHRFTNGQTFLAIMPLVVGMILWEFSSGI